MKVLSGFVAMKMVASELQKRKCRVVIVSRQTLTREGLRLLLVQDQDLHVVGMAMGVDEALESCPQLQPDVVIVVFGWVDHGCAAAIKRLKTELPGLAVLVVSSDIRPEPVQAILAAGAIGYLPLDANLDELVWAAYATGQGELILHPSIMPDLISHLAGLDRGNSQPNVDDLSPREQEVLSHLIRGLCDRDIAQTLFISVRTVQTHLAHVYTKLGVHSRTEAAVIAVQAGWFPQNSESGSDSQNQ
jgi:DNA-binding NarL/FixJ family response regulator